MASDFKIDASQLRRLDRSLSKSGVKFSKGIKRLLKKIGVMVSGLARKYCPESPTKGQYEKTLESGNTLRSNISFTTGALRDSIRFDVEKSAVSINVPANSRGGKYAEKIHDEKGRSWFNRGVRTKEKGAKADEKFIYRAAEDSEGEIDSLIDDVIDDLIKGIGI